jgi:hypothetical protein
VRRRTLVAALGVALVGSVLLARRWPATSEEPWSPEATYFFTDRRDAKWEHLFAVRGREVAVQRAAFPGYTERSWYRATMPDAFHERVKPWAVRAGDLTPPFTPSGPFMIRISPSLDPTRERGEAWFDNTNSEVAQWLDELRREFVRDELRITELPAWIDTDPRVKQYFGY